MNFTQNEYPSSLLLTNNNRIMDSKGVPFQLTTGVWMVPCLIDKSKKSYIPALRPFKTERLSSRQEKRHSWSSEEDENLRAIVLEEGPKHWSAIAVQLNTAVHEGLPVRKGKQCRERWLGHLSPSIHKDRWTEEEDYVLSVKHQVYGNKWSFISKSLPGRTENQIKNRWRQIDCMNKQLIEQQEKLLIEMKKTLMENLMLEAPEYSECDVLTLLDISKGS